MKVYLSARYARREELCRYREQLAGVGIECTARWLDGEGDDLGTNATIDVEDVIAADVLVAFTDEPAEFSPHPWASRGGRHVEVGIAIGAGIPVIVCGPRENIFHHLPSCDGLEQRDTWPDAFGFLVSLQATTPRADEEHDRTQAALRLALREVAVEARSAMAAWGPFNSAHEGFAVLLEEVDELKAHVWTNQRRRELGKMKHEAKQVAAMGLRFMIDVCDEERGRR